MNKTTSMQTMWDKMKSTALDDGNITSDEKSLITAVIQDIDNYFNLVEELLDKKLSDSDKFLLFDMKMNILENAYYIAREDEFISKDESEILKIICDFVNELK